MDIQNPSQALIEHLKEASHLAESIMKSAQQSTQVPVPLRELPAEIQRRMDEYDLSITLLAEQSDVAINTVKKAINNPQTMKIATLEKVIAPLGLSLCFARQ